VWIALYFIAGDLVPADARMLTRLSSSFDVAQDLLTGESKSVEKRIGVVDVDAQLQDKVNILFSGTTVARGKARCVVIGVGAYSEKGKIGTTLSEQADTETPLKKKLDDFGYYLSVAIGIICVVVWAINIGHFSDPVFGGVWKGAIYYFKIAVSLAVAAIPEGLPAVVTTCLALGTQRMAAKNAIVTDLPAVETLGCTSVICSDKTGTLTTNQMSVQRFFVIGRNGDIREFDVEGDSYAPVKEDGSAFSVSSLESGKALKVPILEEPGILQTALICGLCNDASITVNDAGRFEKIGQSTEAAMKVLVEKLGLPEGENEKLAKVTPQVRAIACNKYWEGEFEKVSQGQVLIFWL
jgi:P-type Ca2+ transporter type 2A